MTSGFRLPGDSHRITILGKTGSGKTQAAAWILSNRSYDRRPWIVLDFKIDETLNDIPKTEEIGVRDKIPKHAGVYMVHPVPGEEEQTEAFLWRLWARERAGLFVDEGYMIPKNSPAFQAILTQGRSKSIPVITLSQRPVLVTRFAFSEADFIQMFQLTDGRDKKTVKEFMPVAIDKPIPAFHSFYFDNARNASCVLRPVPDKNTILNTFYDRLSQPRRVL